MKKIKYITPKYPALQIGCGWDKMDNTVNIDKASEVKPDIVVDIEKGLPFPDNSFDKIFSYHCLEHIRPEYWKFVLNEIFRIAKNECVLEMKLPFDNVGQRTNADHYRTFSWHSFDQLKEDGLREYYADLKLVNLRRNPFKLTKLFFYLFPFLKYEVYFKFKVVKKK